MNDDVTNDYEINANDGGKGMLVSERQFEEACLWYARLREPVTAEIEKAQQIAFDEWLKIEPRHEQAFKEAELLWQAMEAPVAQVIDENVHTKTQKIVPIDVKKESKVLAAKPAVFLSRIVAIAACFVVVVSAGVFWKKDISIHLASDYTTAVGEVMPLSLVDGSQVTLNTNSAIAVDMQSERRHIRLLEGEAWFDVSASDPRPFFVETSQGLIRVTGTHFDVRLKGGRTFVSLTEGRVELSVPGSGTEKSPVVLSPGHQALLSKLGVSAVSPFDEAVVTAWLRGQLVFYDTPLIEVIAALNRYRSGRIIVLNNDLEQLKVSGVFATGDTDAALNVISDTLPVQLTRFTDYLVLLR